MIVQPTTGGFLKRMTQGLTKTRKTLSEGLKALFTGKAVVDDTVLEPLTDLLIGADLGPNVTERLIRNVKESLQKKEPTNYDALKNKLKAEIKTILTVADHPPPPPSPPVVTLFIGINGVGKTTTLGKMAARLKREGKRVLLAAGDTFRAGAIQQLSIWGERVGAEVLSSTPGADPAAIAFDAVSMAIARKIDHLFVDTAGRLQTSHNLMEELKKVNRVIGKALPGAPHEKILVLDATTGQNALSQATLFHDAIGVSGMILTKLDGTGRGGILIPIVETLRVPILYLGMGEGADDLLPFTVDPFIEALFEET